jgi:hypothetical protein
LGGLAAGGFGMLAGSIRLKGGEEKELYKLQGADGEGDALFATAFLVENQGPDEIEASCSNLHQGQTLPIAAGKERIFQFGGSGLGTVTVKAGPKGARVICGALNAR